MVVYTRNVQFGERHHRQWDSEALFFQALKFGDDELEQQVELLARAINLMPRGADCYINRGSLRYKQQYFEQKKRQIRVNFCHVG